jgi:hypothetical protein
MGVKRQQGSGDQLDLFDQARQALLRLGVTGELKRRLEVAQKASPTQRRQESLQRDLARTRTPP